MTNYCKELNNAVPNLLALVSKAGITHKDEYIELIKAFSKNLREGQKFVFAKHPSEYLNNKIPKGLKLPFPKVIIEYPSVGESNLIAGRMSCSKNILIAEQINDDEIGLTTAHYFDEVKQWQISPGGIVVKNVGELVLRDSDVYEKGKQLYFKEGMLRFTPLPSLSYEEASQLKTEISEEFVNVIVLLCALANKKVTVYPMSKNGPSDFSPSEKVTIDKYRFVDFTKSSKTLKRGNGTHASPCEHERMGHWRSLKSGKKVWVRNTTICAGNGKPVEKSYIG